MALTKHRVGVILFSWTAGVMYSTLFTMPYLLVAHYHDQGTVRLIYFFINSKHLMNFCKIFSLK